MTRGEIAKQNAAENCNCCQSVLMAFCEDYGIDPELAMSVASGFGSGVCIGEVCGAFTGAVMAMGIIRQSGKEGEENSGVTMPDLVKEYAARFKEKNGSLLCRDLIGYDFSIPGLHDKAEQEGLFVSICRGLIGGSADMMEAYIKEKLT